MTAPGSPAPQGRGGTLPPGVVIANGFSMRLPDGKVAGGDLIATGTGFQVQAQHRAGFGKTVVERFTLLVWEQVRRYELTGTEVVAQTFTSRKSAPSHLLTHASSVLVLHSESDQLVVRSPLAPSQVRQLLGRDLAAVDQRVATFVSPPAPPNLGPSSVADELAKLARLHAQGALTDGEFAAQKALMTPPNAIANFEFDVALAYRRGE